MARLLIVWPVLANMLSQVLIRYGSTSVWKRFIAHLLRLIPIREQL